MLIQPLRCNRQSGAIFFNPPTHQDLKTKNSIMHDSTETITIIEPKKGWVPVDLKEIWNYRELLYFLTKRDIKVRYKPTVPGSLGAESMGRREESRAQTEDGGEQRAVSTG